MLHYDKPAANWNEALPLGNGRLGAMVFGGVNNELLQLNEATLWSGYKKNWDNPAAVDIIPKIRQAAASNNFVAATQLSKQIMGPNTCAYMPLGDLHINLNHANFKNYKRQLDIKNSVLNISYESDNTTYTREYFCSLADNIMAVRFSANVAGSVSFTLNLSSPLVHKISSYGLGINIIGYAPEDFLDKSSYIIQFKDYDTALPQKALRFCVGLICIADRSAVVTNDSGYLKVDDATDVVILFSAKTNYKMANSDNILYYLDELLKNAKLMGYDKLKQRHVYDYKILFDSCSISLGTDKSFDSILTDQRIASHNKTDTGLMQLLFDYGRYLLICSSSIVPANLQGIWNKDTAPPWRSNYTININTQMNYWAAETTGLSKCHIPLLTFIKELSINGAKTAKTNYNYRGWVAHHNTDIWGQTAPVGNYGEENPVWAIWPMGAAWLCSHLWEHFAFTCDVVYLKDFAYPIIKQAALFCIDWLYINPEGYYVTCPSTSPEHQFYDNGELASVCEATTSDMAIIYDLFTNCIEACEVLNIDIKFKNQLTNMRSRLYPIKIAKDGRIQEWSQDFCDEDRQHRHLSHLYGLYPGRQFDDNQKETLKAAELTLKSRGDISTGWGIAWRACLWARLCEGDLAERSLSQFLKPAAESAEHSAGLYHNLFASHPPFQIDGNFGITAAIAEMLLQSHKGYIHILPALPSRWKVGHIKGIKARGGYAIDIFWHQSKLNYCTIKTCEDKKCKILYKLPIQVLHNNIPVKVTKIDLITEFEAKKGEVYIVVSL